MKITFCDFISERWNKLSVMGKVWRYPADGRFAPEAVAIKCVALPIGLIDSIRWCHGGKVRLRATKGENNWNIMEFSEKPVSKCGDFFWWKDFLGQGSHVTQQMSDERRIANYIQQKISNLQEAGKSRKIQKVSVAVTGHVAFEILWSIQNWQSI